MFGLAKYGNGICFKRLLTFCRQHDIDIEAIGRDSVVITGSNGKGSTARFLYACLQTRIERVGCFTSPHLVHLRERFEISGACINDQELERYIGVVLAFNDELNRGGDYLGGFELLFLVALLWFRDNDVTCVVWEAGIGGRYDPVRVLRSPLSALTSIDLEHTELLGPTKQLIAFDKLDVTRPHGETIVSPGVGGDLADDLKAFAEVTGRTLSIISPLSIADIEIRVDSMSYSMVLPSSSERFVIQVPLLGLHQLYN
jgi:dihydrofolate synthase/folylpolyglutamate synthase